VDQRRADFSGFSVVDGRPTIRGDCDLVTSPNIEAWLATFDCQRLEVDLSGVTFFDSSAFRTFLNVKRRNPNMGIVTPSKAVLKILELTGTVEYLVDGATLLARATEGRDHERVLDQTDGRDHSKSRSATDEQATEGGARVADYESPSDAGVRSGRVRSTTRSLSRASSSKNCTP